jgi:hypothetical protein
MPDKKLLHVALPNATAPVVHPPDEPTEAEGSNGELYRASPPPSPSLVLVTEHGENALCNFDARIIARIVADDGESQDHRLRVRVVAPGGTTHTLDLSPKDFASLAWVHQVPGAVLWPPTRKSHVVTAIMLLSRPAEIVVHRHLGWFRSGDAWRWLHAGGVLGSEGASEVRVEPELAALTLPHPPDRDELAAAFRLSLRMLAVSGLRVTVPLLGAVISPVVSNPTFGAMLVGETNNGKSELAAVAQSFVGDGITRGKDLKVAWASSANALEMFCFRAKNHLLVIDDFVPGTASGNEEVIDRLLRAQGNAAGRSRFRGPTYYPRGLILATGEALPLRRSVVARMIVLRVPGQVAWERLTLCQEAMQDGVHAACMAGFIEWLAPRIDQVRAWVRKRESSTVGHFELPGVLRRTPGSLANLEAALAIFFKFGVEVGGVSSDEAGQLLDGVHRALRECLLDQLDVQRAHDPARLLLLRVAQALADGRGHLVPVTGAVAASGEQLGWSKGGVAYLDPEPCLRLARDVGDAGRLSTMTVEQVGAALRSAGLLAIENLRGGRVRHKSRVVVRGKRVDGWAVRLAELQVPPAGGGSAAPAPSQLDWLEDWFA